jgi:uncharacterized protein (TIGR02246 family)
MDMSLKKPLRLTSSLIVTALCACATAPSASPDEIEAVERARFAAWVKGDVAEIAPLLADDLVYCHSSAVCESKAELLHSLASGRTVYRSIDVLEMRPRRADGAVIVNGKAAIKVESSGNPLAFTLVYTDVYVKQDGRWVLATWQSTQVSK